MMLGTEPSLPLVRLASLARPARQCRVTTRGKFPNLLSITAQHSTVCKLGNCFLTEDEIHLETFTSSFVMEAGSAPGEDQCVKQLNLRTRKRLSPVFTDENLPSKRRRRRKFSDCSTSSTSTVAQDSERLAGSPQE